MIKFIAILLIIGMAISAYKEATKPTKKEWGPIFQALETIRILETTVKYDTFISRYQFLLQRIDSFHNKNASEYAKKEYLTKYRLETLSTYQQAILENPESVKEPMLFANMETDFFVRFCDNAEQSMSSLKTTAAKERRREKVLETSKIIMENDLNSIMFKEQHQIIIQQLERFDIHTGVNYDE